MTQALRAYLLAICAVSLLSALVMALLPQGGARRAAALACGLLLTAAALGPLLKLNTGLLAQKLAELQLEAEEQRTGVAVRNRELIAQIIKEKTETYILDKAADIGAEVQAEVTMNEEQGQPYPESVRLTGRASDEQKRVLGEYIEENFAVPARRQEWTSG